MQLESNRITPAFSPTLDAHPSPRRVLASRFFSAEGVPPLHVVAARGCRLELDGGQSLIDASGGPMVANLGHAHPDVVASLRAAMSGPSYVMPFFSCPTRLACIEALRAFMPQTHGRIFLTSGGSEAVETAFKVAHAHHVARGEAQRTIVIGRELSYHGSTWATMAASDARPFRAVHRAAMPDWPKLRLPRAHWTPAGPPEDLDVQAYADDLEAAILRAGPTRVSAVIVEPIGAAMSSVLIPPAGYYEALAELCHRYGVLMIADEVVTGFGRTGKAFGFEHWDFVPDIIAFAKGVTGGHAPLGGIAVREEIVAALEDAGVDPGARFTFSGHPLACAAATATLRVLERDRLVERVAQREDDLRARFDALRHQPIVRDIRGRGMLWALSLGVDGEHFSSAMKVRQRLLMQLFIRGVLAWPAYGCDAQGRGDAIIIAPPYIVDDTTLDLIFAALAQSLDAVALGLGHDTRRQCAG